MRTTKAKFLKSRKSIENIFYVSFLSFSIISICIILILVFMSLTKKENTNNKNYISHNNILGLSTTTVNVSVCGDNIKQFGEECDLSDLDNKNCNFFGYIGGILKCNLNCTFDKSDCIVLYENCGNGIKENNEECDGKDFQNLSCKSFDFDFGNLLCNSNCTINKSNCFKLKSKEYQDNYEQISSFDSDNDGMPDYWEDKYSCINKLIYDSQLDPDNDLLINLFEFEHNTNPCDPDTDNDGMPDYFEVYYGLNPLIDDSKEDPDNDGYTNLEEFINNTNPRIPDIKNSYKYLPSTGDKIDSQKIFLSLIFFIFIFFVILLSIFVFYLRKLKK